MNRFIRSFVRVVLPVAFCLCLALLSTSCQSNDPTIQTSSTSPSGNTIPSTVPGTTTEAVPLVTVNTTSTQPSTTPLITTTAELVPSRQMKVRVMTATIYRSANRTAPVIARIPWLNEIGYISGPDAQGFNLVRTADGLYGYCLNNQLAEKTAVLYAKIPEISALSVIPGYTGSEKKSQMVDVRQADPSICIDLIFATTRNFTGVKLYERDICLLQQGTIAKLKKAQALFRKDGFSIKIYDAYRPYSVTVKLAEFNSNPMYLADPLKGSIHNRGAAVDMTVVNSKGIELKMPSLIHTLDASASRTNLKMSVEARQNLDYVQSIMVQCGFIPYAHEWWHYSDTESSRYPHLDLSLAEVEMVVAAKKPTITPPPVRDPSKTGFVNVPIELVPTPTPTPSPSPAPSPAQT